MWTPTDEETDAELIHHARRGVASAWRTIVRRHTPAVYRLAARMLGPGPDAEDACQETFMKAHRAFDTYDASRPLAPWLGRIAYTSCLRRLTTVRHERGVSAGEADLAQLADAHGASPEREVAAREAGRAVSAALAQLSAQDRAMVTLTYVDGLTDAEVGAAVGMPRNTVRTRLYRARAVLRRALGPLLGGGSE